MTGTTEGGQQPEAPAVTEDELANALARRHFDKPREGAEFLARILFADIGAHREPAVSPHPVAAVLEAQSPADPADDTGRALPIARESAQERAGGSWRQRAEAAEARLAAQREYDTYRRALWVLVRQFGGHVFLTSGQMEDVPLLAGLGCGREPGGLRIIAEEEA